MLPAGATTPTLAQLEALGGLVLGHGGHGDKTDGIKRPLTYAVTVDTTRRRRRQDLRRRRARRGLRRRRRRHAHHQLRRDGGAAGRRRRRPRRQRLRRLGARRLRPADIDRIYSIDPDLGGSDKIITGSGDDIVIGGEDGERIREVLGAGGAVTQVTDPDPVLGDDINAGDGLNVVLGDSGTITSSVVNAPFGSLPISLGLVTTIAPDLGGDDKITTGVGRDYIIGGTGADTIVSNAGESASKPDAGDLVLGDSGYMDWVVLDGDANDVDRIYSIAPGVGGIDKITTGGGDDIVIGGLAGDDINAGDGMNLVIGDSGTIDATLLSAPFGTLPISLSLVQTIAPSLGGDDAITTGTGKDLILGGVGADTISSGASNDIVLGDNGMLQFAEIAATATVPETRLQYLRTTDHVLGGADWIYGGAGEDLVIGGSAADHDRRRRRRRPDLRRPGRGSSRAARGRRSPTRASRRSPARSIYSRTDQPCRTASVAATTQRRRAGHHDVGRLPRPERPAAGLGAATWSVNLFHTTRRRPTSTPARKQTSATTTSPAARATT